MASWPGSALRVAVLAVVLALTLGLVTVVLLLVHDARARPRVGREREATDADAAQQTEPPLALAPGSPAAPAPRPATAGDGPRARASDQAASTPPEPATVEHGAEAKPEGAHPAGTSGKAPTRARSPVRAECDIRWWRGYVYSRFYAFAHGADGEERVIAESPDFRWRKAQPPPEEGGALEAHRTLVETLVESDWTVVGRGEEWFSLQLRRSVGAARPPGDRRE